MGKLKDFGREAQGAESKKEINPELKELLDEMPPCMRGLSGAWLIFTVLDVICFFISIFSALLESVPVAVIFGVIGTFLLIMSNYVFRSRVIFPITGLADMAKRISEGSYGFLKKKEHDDEVGDLTDAINDMSVKLAAAEKTQTEFISSVSHELRTPLTAITGWSETLLCDEAIQGDSRRGIEIISKESERLGNLVGGILEFTRIQDGRFTLNLEPVDMCAELEDIVFTYREIFTRDGLELVYSAPENGVPEITGDPHRLHQVVLNILDNAVKYAGKGVVELSLKQNGEYVEISVRDHGPGISETDLPYVKKKFFKGSSKQRGSGIGLSVCDEIVNRHGGKLDISNAPGGGALVKVSLPVKTQ